MSEQICVWPGTLCGPEKIAEFEKFMQDEFKVKVKYLEEVVTGPGKGGPGGRNDLFFSVAAEDTGRFAVQRLAYGIRWWEDVLGNGDGCLYPQKVLTRYPKSW